MYNQLMEKTGMAYMNSLVQGFEDGNALHRGLAKALSSGSTIDSTLPDSTATSISPLRLEDLQNVLTSLTITQKQLVLWRWLEKGSVFNVTYQYNTRDTLGKRRASPFYIEAGKPFEQDETFTRHLRNIRYLGVEKEITLPATLQKLGGGVSNIEVEAVTNGTTLLLRQLEDWLFFGNEDLDDTDLAFDGIEEQIIDNAPADNIIDLEGVYLQSSNLEDGMARLNKGYSNFNKIGLFMSTDAVKNFSKPYKAAGANSQERFIVDNQTGTVKVVGNAIRGYDSQYGHLPFYPSVIINENREDVSVADFLTMDTVNSATVNAATDLTVTPVGDTTSNMTAGTYFYSIVTMAREGSSVPVHTATGTACLLNQRLDLRWDAPASGESNGYYIFRHDADPSVAANQSSVKLVRTVGLTPRIYYDRNQWRPGTSEAFLLDGEFTNLGVLQLAPFMKLPLARVTTAERFLLLLFVDVVIRAAKRQVMYKNVGSTSP